SVSLARPPPSATLFPYTTLFRSNVERTPRSYPSATDRADGRRTDVPRNRPPVRGGHDRAPGHAHGRAGAPRCRPDPAALRAGTRSEEHTLNSSHVKISYAVFCLK